MEREVVVVDVILYLGDDGDALLGVRVVVDGFENPKIIFLHWQNGFYTSEMRER